MGKFPDETCEALWDLTLDSAHDDECGDASFDRWYGLCLNTGIDGAEHAIVREDTQGFVDYETYESAEKARSEFERIEREIADETDEFSLPAVVLE